MKTERALQSRCLIAARKAGWLAYKFASPAHRGVPDVLLLGEGGRTLFVEFKHPNGKGKLSELQKVVIDEMRGLGADVRVIDSFEDFMEALCQK